MSSSVPEPSAPRALVLGGGGLAGIAWEVGVLVGLGAAGVDVTDAGRVLGTSAGSVVGTLVATDVDLAAVHAAHRDPERSSESGTPAVLDADKLMAALAEAVSGARDARDARARIGAWALSVETVPEAERREIIAARLPVHDWPDPARRDLRITAVDAGTGDAVVFSAADGVGLVDAVAASCAVPGVWPPMTVGSRRYVDGGVRSIVGIDAVDDGLSSDLGQAGPVLVVAPLDPPPGGPMESVAAEADRRRRNRPDAGVVALVADAESRAAFGPDVLDPASMPASAAAGRRQGQAAADEVRALWAPS